MPTPAFKRKRPAPRTATGWGKPVTEDVTWSREWPPAEREIYRIRYAKSDGTISERTIELAKIGAIKDVPYLGVFDRGRFKTMRADRVVAVLEQLAPPPGERGEPSIHAWPTYADTLPAFPLPAAVYKVPTTAVSKRTWTVDLNRWSCTCPEKRERTGMGYRPGQLGFVCDHIAKAIHANLPPNSPGWTPELLHFLADPRRVHIDNLTSLPEHPADRR